MPRAENRKRPPNSLGGGVGNGGHGKSHGSPTPTEHHAAQNKKQALFEKMKQAQKSQAAKAAPMADGHDAQS